MIFLRDTILVTSHFHLKQPHLRPVLVITCYFSGISFCIKCSYTCFIFNYYFAAEIALNNCYISASSLQPQKLLIWTLKQQYLKSASSLCQIYMSLNQRGTSIKMVLFSSRVRRTLVHAIHFSVSVMTKRKYGKNPITDNLYFFRYISHRQTPT